MDLTVRMVLVYAMPEQAKKDAIKDITNYLTMDKISNRMVDIFNLEDIPAAHLAIEGGNNYGTILLKITQQAI